MNIPVYHEKSFSYICISDVPDEYYYEFLKWIGGQTRPVVDEHDDAVYAWDWNRWLDWRTGVSDLLIFD